MHYMITVVDLRNVEKEAEAGAEAEVEDAEEVRPLRTPVPELPLSVP